ncbi:MAG: hypothetical protein HOP11_08465 [Saprospiraceae bacterium]|nr:hypothetical protein [Saprospiraceae bacterium]
MRKFLSFFLVVSLFSCNNDETYTVDPAFTEFIVTFNKEAQLRSLDYSEQLQELNIKFSLLNDNAVGQCQKSKDSHTILIDQTYWNSLSILDKELILFHELGHCILNREHIDSSNNRICNSIMRSSNTVCRMNYNSTSRKNYLDELFSY